MVTEFQCKLHCAATSLCCFVVKNHGINGIQGSTFYHTIFWIVSANEHPKLKLTISLYFQDRSDDDHFKEHETEEDYAPKPGKKRAAVSDKNKNKKQRANAVYFPWKQES